MEPKKNPKANVGRNSSLYFAVGLALMLFLSYLALITKLTIKSDIDIGHLDLMIDDEEIPITEILNTPPPPPPPPAAPEVIEVVEDEEEVEETVLNLQKQLKKK